jgi:hypothetical protein
MGGSASRRSSRAPRRVVLPLKKQPACERRNELLSYRPSDPVLYSAEGPMQTKLLLAFATALLIVVPTTSFAAQCTQEQEGICARMGADFIDCTQLSCVPHKVRWKGDLPYRCVKGFKAVGTRCSNNLRCLRFGFGTCDQNGGCNGPALNCYPASNAPKNTVCWCLNFQCQARNTGPQPPGTPQPSPSMVCTGPQ